MEMSKFHGVSTSPHVGVYALIGRGEHLLVIERPDHRCLPGGTVSAGEPIERALERTLRDQIDGTIAILEFCAVIEHGATVPGNSAASEVAFLFDVTLADQESVNLSPPSPLRWAGEQELLSLRPKAVRDELIAATLSADEPWRAWRP